MAEVVTTFTTFETDITVDFQLHVTIESTSEVGPAYTSGSHKVTVSNQPVGAAGARRYTRWFPIATTRESILAECATFMTWAEDH